MPSHSALGYFFLVTQDLSGQLADAVNIDLIKDSSLRWRVVENSVRFSGVESKSRFEDGGQCRNS